jgi:chromosome segregation ATPase
LQGDLQQKNETIRKMKECHGEVVSDFESQADEANQMYQKLSMELRNEKGDHEHTQNEVVKLKNEVKVLIEQLEERKKELQRLKDESSSMKTTVSSAGQFIENFQKAETEKVAMKQERDTLKKELLKLKGLHTKTSENLEKCRMQLKETEDKLMNKDSECQTASEQLKKTQKNNEAWDKAYKQLDGDYKKVKASTVLLKFTVIDEIIEQLVRS